jgi:hypothetical protein
MSEVRPAWYRRVRARHLAMSTVASGLAYLGFLYGSWVIYELSHDLSLVLLLAAAAFYIATVLLAVVAGTWAAWSRLWFLSCIAAGIPAGAATILLLALLSAPIWNRANY